MKKILGLFLTLFLALTLASCLGKSAKDLVAEAKADLTVVYSNGDSESSVTKKVTLITQGKNETVITWSSSDTNVIANDGSVTRPAFGSGDKQVTLTATLSLKDATDTKTFTLTVKETPQTDAQKLEEAKAALAVEFAVGDSATSVTNNVTLPATVDGATVTWSSSNANVLTNAGVVDTPAYGLADVTIVLTATLTLNNETTTKPFTLVVKADTVLKDTDAVLDTKNKILILSGETSADANFELPTAGQNGTTISWTSSNSDVITVTTDVMGAGVKAKVTRPEFGAEDVSVTLTATVTKNDASVTRTFEITVKALTTPPATIASFKYTAEKGNEFTFQATVIGLSITESNKGMYIWDGTDSIYVYVGSTAPTVAIGDKIKITGTYDNYYGQPELKSPAYEVISSNNPLPTPVLKSLTDFNMTPSTRTPEHSEYIRIENALITKETTTYYLNQGTLKFIVWDETKGGANVLESYVNKTVNINIIPDSYHSTLLTWRVTFQNNAGDIEEHQLTDAEKVEQALPLVTLPTETDKNLTLPATTTNGVNVSWSSDHPEIIAADGSVTLPAEVTVVTLTATFTLNDASQTKTFTVTVLNAVIPAQTVADVLPVADGTVVKVEALVIANSMYGYVVYSGNAYGFVYTNAVGTAVPGDIIVFNATMGTYSGLRQLQYPTIIETKSSGNALPTMAAGTIGDLMARTITGATVTGTVSIEGATADVFLTDPTTPANKVKVYYKSTQSFLDTNGAVLKSYEGMTISVPVVMYQNGTVLFLGKDTDVTVISGERPVKTVPQANDTTDTTIIRVQGVVLANSGYGYLIYSDGEYGFVYTNAVGTQTAGDMLDLTVKVSSYKGLKQLTNPTNVTVLSSGNPLPTVPAGTIAQLMARTINMATITANVTIEGTNSNVFLTDAAGNKLQVYYKSTPDYQATNGQVLKDFVGKTITLPVYMYQDGLVLFIGTASDVTEVTDTMKVATTKDQLTLPGTVASSLTLPATGFFTTITWSSDNTTVIANDGTVTRPVVGQPDAIVNLTATITSGTVTDTKVIAVTVKAIGATESVIYSTGFEAPDFTAGSTYNNATPALFGPASSQWSFVYGTPTTTDKITGGQSAQMRWYTSAKTTYGYMQTNFALLDVTKVTFNAKGTNGLNVTASYSTDGVTFTGAETFTLTATSAPYTYNLNSTNPTGFVYIRFQISYTTEPTTTSRLTIDDIAVYGLQA